MEKFASNLFAMALSDKEFLESLFISKILNKNNRIIEFNIAK